MVFLIHYLEIYIEDIYFPHPATKISQIIDLLTDEIEVPIEVEDDFIDFRIFAINLYNKELSFLSDGKNIFINLEPFDSFPFVSKGLKNTDIINSCSKLRHVKIEIRYILSKPNITGSEFKKWSTIGINGYPLEIHITSPLGFKISGPKEGYAIGIQDISINSTNKIMVNAPFIYEKQGKRVYSYYLYSGYKKEDILENTQIKNRVEITYISSIEPMGVIIFLIIPFMFVCFSLAIIVEKLNFIQFGIISAPNNSISFLILLMGYFYFYHSCIKEGQHIPYRQYFVYLFLISFFVAIIWAFFSSSSPDLLQIVIESNTSQIVIESNTSQIVNESNLDSI